MGDVYKHKKTEGLYEILAEKAELEGTGGVVVAYRDTNSGRTWVRDADKFFDGRFELIETAPDFNPLADIRAFHRKFDLAYDGLPRVLNTELHNFRCKFSAEEAVEHENAVNLLLEELQSDTPSSEIIAEQLENMLDAHVDKMYVDLGTVYLEGFGLVFAEAWRRVHERNMAKVRATDASQSARGSTSDVVKPAGWYPPDHSDLVMENAYSEDLIPVHHVEEVPNNPLPLGDKGPELETVTGDTGKKTKKR